MRQKLALIIILISPALAHAQAWSGVIDPIRALDWSTPGVTGGIPTRTTICTTLNPGATAAQINSAINSCASNQVVFLNAGTYNLSTEIAMKSDVTLRGAGANSTLLKFTSGGGACSLPGTEDVCFTGSFNWNGNPQHLTTWTAGYSKGTTVITLGSVSGLSVGQLLILDQADDTSDPGLTAPLVNGTSTSFSTEAGSPGRTVSGVLYTQQEYKLVTAINGNQVTVSTPIYMSNWRTGQHPSAWWATTLMQNAGIENLTLDHSSSSNLSGVTFFDAYNCWLKGIRSIYAQNSNGGGRNHVWFQYSARITVRDSYFYGTRDSATLSYGVEPWQSGDLLVENNIFQHIVSPILPGGTEGSVFAYNYSIDHYFAANADWNMPGPSFTHDSGVALNLFEGNQGTGMVEDDIHGTHNLDTYFRNHWIGRDPGRTSHSMTIEIASFSRFMNLIGNVMGEAGYDTTYQVTPPTLTNCSTAIYLIGWQSACNGGSPDALVLSTLMRWGNYDTVTGTVRFNSGEVPTGIGTFANTVPASQTLPSSFYLSAQPTAWWSTPWGTPAWPPVGPDVTGGNITGWAGHANKNPARLCYENTTKTGNILNFDANACYASTPAPFVSFSPTSLGFANRVILTTSAALTATLTNTGSATLTISSITLTGTNSGDFAISANTCGGTVAASANCAISVTFTPSATGARTASISVADDASGSPQTVPLAGIGIVAIPAPSVHKPVMMGRL